MNDLIKALRSFPLFYRVGNDPQWNRSQDTEPLCIAAADRIEELEAALARSDWVSGWQPIETAPHTGIAILVYQPWKSGRNTIEITHYANGWICWRDHEMEMEPTHWMPLPQPPDRGQG